MNHCPACRALKNCDDPPLNTFALCNDCGALLVFEVDGVRIFTDAEIAALPDEDLVFINILRGAFIQAKSARVKH